jgi:hypothetical protein
MSVPLNLLSQDEFDLLYDYSRIPDEQDRRLVQNAARRIKPRLKRAAQDIFDSGRELIAVKDRLPYGEWGPWLETEFGLSDRMAQNWMNVARRLGVKSEKFSELPVSVLYLLASPSTKVEVIEQVKERLEEGIRPTVADIKELKATRRHLQGSTHIEIVQEKDGSQWVVQESDREAAYAMSKELHRLLDQMKANGREAEYKRLTGGGLHLQHAINYLQWAVETLERLGEQEDKAAIV